MKTKIKIIMIVEVVLIVVMAGFLIWYFKFQNNNHSPSENQLNHSSDKKEEQKQDNVEPENKSVKVVEEEQLVGAAGLGGDVERKFYQVAKVVDGDTIEVLIDGKIEIVRFIGIDTPEMRHYSAPAQCFSQEATQKANKLMKDKEVRLERDAVLPERDVHKRLLRYVYLKDETFLNKILIEEGFSVEYTYDVPYVYQSYFKQLEKNAKEKGLGLWGKKTCNGKL